MKVLLVDDEEQLVSALAERLSLRGIKAAWATNCLDALGLVELEDFDVAVLDVKMPKMCGFELKEKIQEKRPRMRFIFVTGHGSEEDFRVGSAEGGGYYLVKPVNIEVLIKKMKQILEEHRNKQ